MLRTYRHPLSLLWMVVLFLFAASAWADSHVRIVRLSYVDGDVQMDRATGNGFEKAILNMPVVYQSHIRTGDDGTAELEFENGSTLRLTPDTQISVADLSLTESGVKVTRVNLDHGLAYLEWKRKDDNSFEITTGGHTMTLKKSTHLRIHSDDQALSLAVFNGEASITGGPEGQIAVKKGETLSFDNSDARYFLAKSVQTGPYDSWDKDRDDARTLVARQQSNYLPGSMSYGPDLGYYGDWFDSPYGTVWQPYYTGAGWSPYADGSWAFYPNLGWNWVSAYPWGFLPYHYGNWIFVNGRGWCWQRPTHWRGWQNFSPATNLYANGHGSGIIPPNGGHGTGVPPVGNSFVPHPPARPVKGGESTLISVGRGPSAPWRNPALKDGREINPQAFRGGAANRAVREADGPVRVNRPPVASGNVNNDRVTAPMPAASGNNRNMRENRGGLPNRKVEASPAPSGSGMTPRVSPRAPEVAPRSMPAPAPRMSEPPRPAPAPMPRISQPAPRAMPAPMPRMSAPSMGGGGFGGGRMGGESSSRPGSGGTRPK